MSSLSEEVIVRSLMAVIDSHLPLCDKKAHGSAYAEPREFVTQCVFEIIRRLPKCDPPAKIYEDWFVFIARISDSLGW